MGRYRYLFGRYQVERSTIAIPMYCIAAYIVCVYVAFIHSSLSVNMASFEVDLLFREENVGSEFVTLLLQYNPIGKGWA